MLELCSKSSGTILPRFPKAVTGGEWKEAAYSIFVNALQLTAALRLDARIAANSLQIACK